ncbi:mediator complex subunit, partial [Ascosphaera acerosa]
MTNGGNAVTRRDDAIGCEFGNAMLGDVLDGRQKGNGTRLVWRRLLRTWLIERTEIDEFARLAQLALARYRVSSTTLVELLLDLRQSIGVSWDPLVPGYLDCLYRLRKVALQDILRCLLRRSTLLHSQRPPGDDNGRRCKRRRAGADGQTFMSDYRIIQSSLIAVTSGYPPLTKADATEAIMAVALWMEVAAACMGNALSDDGQGEGSKSLLGMSSGVSLVEALGVFAAGLLATQPTIDAVISLRPDMKKSLSRALNSYLTACSGLSTPLMMRLQSLQKEFQLSVEDAHIAQAPEGDALSALNFKASIVDGPAVISRAGLYVYINAMGNPIAAAEELIVAAFDVLANAHNRNESLFLPKTFLIHKVPFLLQQLMASSVQPLQLQLAISHALERVDSQTFPAFSALFVNSFHKSSPLSDVRQEFVFSCALHKLVPEAKIEVLLGENPMQSLPSGGQMTRADVISQLLQFPDRTEQFMKKVESMDGNAGVIAAIIHLCEKRDTAGLQGLCSHIVRRPQVIDVVLLFVGPRTFIPSLVNLIDSWSSQPEGSKRQSYGEFSNILLMVLAIRHRADLSARDLGIGTPNSFTAWVLAHGHLSRPLEDVSKDDVGYIGSWIRALFVSDGVSDDDISCSPQAYYRLLPMVVSQSVNACGRNRIAPDTLKAGFESESHALLTQIPGPETRHRQLTLVTGFLQPFLLPSLYFALAWFGQYLTNYEGPIDHCLSALEALVKPANISGETQEMHRVVMQMASESLETSLRSAWAKHPNQTENVSRILQALSNFPSYQRSSASERSQFKGWASDSASGGMAAELMSTVSSLVYWSTNPAINLMPFSYTHHGILAGLRIVGASRVLAGILKELQE